MLHLNDAGVAVICPRQIAFRWKENRWLGSSDESVWSHRPPSLGHHNGDNLDRLLVLRNLPCEMAIQDWLQSFSAVSVTVRFGSIPAIPSGVPSVRFSPPGAPPLLREQRIADRRRSPCMTCAAWHLCRGCSCSLHMALIRRLEKIQASKTCAERRYFPSGFFSARRVRRCRLNQSAMTSTGRKAAETTVGSTAIRCAFTMPSSRYFSRFTA